jgi:hypothetical protein
MRSSCASVGRVRKIGRMSLLAARSDGSSCHPTLPSRDLRVSSHTHPRIVPYPVPNTMVSPPPRLRVLAVLHHPSRARRFISLVTGLTLPRARALAGRSQPQGVPARRCGPHQLDPRPRPAGELPLRTRFSDMASLHRTGRTQSLTLVLVVSNRPRTTSRYAY